MSFTVWGLSLLVALATAAIDLPDFKAHSAPSKLMMGAIVTGVVGIVLLVMSVLSGSARIGRRVSARFPNLAEELPAAGRYLLVSAACLTFFATGGMIKAHLLDQAGTSSSEIEVATEGELIPTPPNTGSRPADAHPVPPTTAPPTTAAPATTTTVRSPQNRGTTDPAATPLDSGSSPTSQGPTTTNPETKKTEPPSAPSTSAGRPPSNSPGAGGVPARPPADDSVVVDLQRTINEGLYGMFDVQASTTQPLACVRQIDVTFGDGTAFDAAAAWDLPRRGKSGVQGLVPHTFASSGIFNVKVVVAVGPCDGSGAVKTHIFPFTVVISGG